MKARRRSRIIVGAIALGLVAAACSSNSDGTDATPSQSVPATLDAGAPGATTTAPTVAVPEALQFSAPLVGGGEFTGADYADKPTVFWFWAPT